MTMLVAEWSFPFGPQSRGAARIQSSMDNRATAWASAAACTMARLLASTHGTPEETLLLQPAVDLASRVAAAHAGDDEAYRSVLAALCGHAVWDATATKRTVRMEVSAGPPGTPLAKLPVIFIRKRGYGLFSLASAPPTPPEIVAMPALLFHAAQAELDDRAVLLGMAEAMSVVAQLKVQGFFGLMSPGFNQAAAMGTHAARKLLGLA